MIKYGELYIAKEPLQKLSTMSFESKTQMKVTRLVRWGLSVIEDLDAVRQKLIEEYASRDEAGNMVASEDKRGIKLDNPEAFSDEMTMLMQMEVDDFDPEKYVLTLEELNTVRGDTRLLVGEQAQLGKLLEGHEEVKSRVGDLLNKLGHEDSEE